MSEALMFIETDELQRFQANGGTREVRYANGGFEFGYTFGGRWASFRLPDEIVDPSERERSILRCEAVVLVGLA